MEDFIIIKIDKEYANYLIFGISSESPLFELDKIREKATFCDGDKILFDQLLQTGSNKNRFLILSYQNNDFDTGTATNIDTSLIDVDTRLKVADFLRQNKDILKYSILVSSQKDQILSGGII